MKTQSEHIVRYHRIYIKKSLRRDILFINIRCMYPRYMYSGSICINSLVHAPYIQVLVYVQWQYMYKLSCNYAAYIQVLVSVHSQYEKGYGLLTIE